MPNDALSANAQATPTDRRAFLGAIGAVAALLGAPGGANADAAAPGEKVCSIEELAALEFEPWQDVGEQKKVMAEIESDAFSTLHLPYARAALLLMYKSKAELEAVAINMAEGDNLENLLDNVAATKELFEVYTQVLQAAELRLMSAAICAYKRRPEAFTKRGEA